MKVKIENENWTFEIVIENLILSFTLKFIINVKIWNRKIELKWKIKNEIENLKSKNWKIKIGIWNKIEIEDKNLRLKVDIENWKLKMVSFL